VAGAITASPDNPDMAITASPACKGARSPTHISAFFLPPFHTHPPTHTRTHTRNTNETKTSPLTHVRANSCSQLTILPQPIAGGVEQLLQLLHAHSYQGKKRAGHGAFRARALEVVVNDADMYIVATSDSMSVYLYTSMFTQICLRRSYAARLSVRPSVPPRGTSCLFEAPGGNVLSSCLSEANNRIGGTCCPQPPPCLPAIRFCT
jgi:hypothetical protein